MQTSSFFSLSDSSLRVLSSSSLVFFSLVLVSGRRLTFDNESMRVNTAATRGTVSAALDAEGAVKLRMTCFSRSLGGIGPLVGRSLGWSVTLG